MCRSHCWANVNCAKELKKRLWDVTQKICVVYCDLFVYEPCSLVSYSFSEKHNASISITRDGGSMYPHSTLVPNYQTKRYEGTSQYESSPTSKPVGCAEKPHALLPVLWAGIAQSVQRLATGWTVRGSNPVGGDIFRTRPNRQWGPPSLLYNGYRVCLGVKEVRTWRWPSPPSSAEVNERVELYLSSTSEPS